MKGANTEPGAEQAPQSLLVHEFEQFEATSLCRTRSKRNWGGGQLQTGTIDLKAQASSLGHPIVPPQNAKQASQTDAMCRIHIYWYKYST